MRQPAIFLSHGAPTFILEENAATRFWQSLPGMLPAKPRAILCMSAHWDQPRFCLSGSLGMPGIQHDYYGFPKALYDIDWPQHEDNTTAKWLVKRLQELKIDVLEDSWAMDHGLWVSLKKAWPEPDFPVYQLSLCLAQGLDSHWALGQKLSVLRDEGVLIIGSGGITHNLHEIDWHAADEHAVTWAQEFVDAVELAISKQDRLALCNPWQLPNGKKCHPSIEHYAPLLLAMGAANGEIVNAIHRSWKFGTIALHAYAAGL